MYDILWFPTCKSEDMHFRKLFVFFFYFILLTTYFKRIGLRTLEIQSILHGLISVKAGIDVSSLFLWN